MTDFYWSILSPCSVSQSFWPHIFLRPRLCVLFTRVTGASGDRLILLLLLSHTRMDHHTQCWRPLKPCQHRARICRVSVKKCLFEHYVKVNWWGLECFGLLHYFDKLFCLMFLHIIFWLFVYSSRLTVDRLLITGNLFMQSIYTTRKK